MENGGHVTTVEGIGASLPTEQRHSLESDDRSEEALFGSVGMGVDAEGGRAQTRPRESSDEEAALVIEQEKGTALRAYSIESHTKDKPFLLMPGEFVLAHTLEKFNVPDDVAANFALKSSLARAGFEHLLAGFIDPGFSNSVLTLELKNARKMHPVPLWPGMRIGQVVWHRMTSSPNVSYRYSGRYNGDSKVTGCKGLL